MSRDEADHPEKSRLLAQSPIQTVETSLAHPGCHCMKITMSCNRARIPLGSYRMHRMMLCRANGVTCAKADPQGTSLVRGKYVKPRCPVFWLQPRKYTDVEATIKCISCPVGFYTEEGSTTCLPCQGGRHSAFGSSQCTKCDLGTYGKDSRVWIVQGTLLGHCGSTTVQAAQAVRSRMLKLRHGKPPWKRKWL